MLNFAFCLQQLASIHNKIGKEKIQYLSSGIKETNPNLLSLPAAYVSLLLFTSPRGTEKAMREREEEENRRGVDTEGGGEITQRGRGGGRVS